MTGIVGRLFREFAITMSVAVGVSAFVSLTLTPMMCAKLLRSEARMQEHAGEFYRRTEEYLDTVPQLVRTRIALGAGASDVSS